MRILYVTEVYPDPSRGLGVWGGGEKQFYEVSQRVSAAGVEATVLTCRFPGQPARDRAGSVWVRRAGLTRDRTSGGPRRSPAHMAAYIALTVREALRERFDVIHCNTYLPVFAGCIAGRVRRAPVVVTFHDVFEAGDWGEHLGSAFWGAVASIVTKAAARASTGQIIAVSPQTKEKLRRLGVSGDSITVIPNGVELRQFGPGPHAGKPHRVLYVGRLVKLKAVDQLLLAFAEVVKSVGGAELAIVGDGPARSELEALAARLGIAEKVRFYGRTATYEDVLKHYEDAQVVVLPSAAEGEGIVLKEAMAAGIPVVGVAVPRSGVNSIVAQGENGFLVPPGDPQQLAERIVALLDDPALRGAMGEAGRRSVVGMGWESVAKATLGVYFRALRPRRS
ncbi:MAG: glycosyltransferase family 4 protein [Nitrososphaerota archaeon]|nr:glycosyltransferase family 4 protein [Nitrososphaerota archaeon]